MGEIGSRQQSGIAVVVSVSVHELAHESVFSPFSQELQRCPLTPSQCISALFSPFSWYLYPSFQLIIAALAPSLPHNLSALLLKLPSSGPVLNSKFQQDSRERMSPLFHLDIPVGGDHQDYGQAILGSHVPHQSNLVLSDNGVTDSSGQRLWGDLSKHSSQHWGHETDKTLHQGAATVGEDT